jgi:putative transposase
MSTILTFHALLKAIPRAFFDESVARHNADKDVKCFRHWNHLVAMVHGQLGGATSLRGLALGFNSHCKYGKIIDTGAIRRSTLADANKWREGQVFDDVAGWLITQVSGQHRKEKNRLRLLLDSTSITLKGWEFDAWTEPTRTRNTQGLKFHVLLDAEAKAPIGYSLSSPNVNDSEQALQIPLQPGALYVFDKGYCDYNWWQKIDAAGAHFVTRFKENAALIVDEEREIPPEEPALVARDQIVRFKYKSTVKGRSNRYEKTLRRIEIIREGKPPLVLATNDLESSPATIAQYYKDRWGIELFFKWIKQHLKIKKFFGRSLNAVHNQIVTALITYLLVMLYSQTHGLNYTLWENFGIISANLFNRTVTSNSMAPPSPRRSPDLIKTQRRQEK